MLTLRNPFFEHHHGNILGRYMKIELSASILSADFSKLGEEIKCAEEAGVDRIHFDIMDGSFVPNISMGIPVVKSLRKTSSLPFDVHLMIIFPERYAKKFAKAGADLIYFHIESCKRPFQLISELKKMKKRVGVALNPSTSLEAIGYIMDMVDEVLVMTVEPGFGGQEFIKEMFRKVSELKEKIESKGLNVRIAVDGGINKKTAPLAVSFGASVLISGSAIFREGDIYTAVKQLRTSLLQKL